MNRSKLGCQDVHNYRLITQHNYLRCQTLCPLAFKAKGIFQYVFISLSLQSQISCHFYNNVKKICHFECDFSSVLLRYFGFNQAKNRSTLNAGFIYLDRTVFLLLSFNYYFTIDKYETLVTFTICHIMLIYILFYDVPVHAEPPLPYLAEFPCFL